MHLYSNVCVCVCGVCVCVFVCVCVIIFLDLREKWHRKPGPMMQMPY